MQAQNGSRGTSKYFSIGFNRSSSNIKKWVLEPVLGEKVDHPAEPYDTQESKIVQ